MRHSPTDPTQKTIKDRDGWNAELDGHRLHSEADLADDMERQDRLRRAGSEPRMESGPEYDREAGREVAVPGSSWLDIKSRFVDDPKGALAAAEQLVQQAAEAHIRALQAEASAVCARDRELDDESSTEAMRTRLLRYQQYCEQLGDRMVH
jgi:hypothetical protein